MNKTLKVLLASVITVSASAAMASDNWQNGDGSLNWKNGDGTLCWRDNNWTPATAAKGCDGALVPAAAPLLLALPKARSLCKPTHFMTLTKLH